MSIERILNRLETIELAALPNIRKGDRIIVNSETSRNPEIWVGTVYRVKRDKSQFRCIFDDDFWMDMPITNSGTGLIGFASTLKKRKSPILLDELGRWVDQDKWQSNWLRGQINTVDKLDPPIDPPKVQGLSRAKDTAVKISRLLLDKGYNCKVAPKKWLYASGKPPVVDLLKEISKSMNLEWKKSKDIKPPVDYSMGEYQIYDVYSGSEFLFHLSISVVSPVVDKSKPDNSRNNQLTSPNRHPDSSTQTTPIVAKVINSLSSDTTYKAGRVTRGFQTLEIWAKNRSQLGSMLEFLKENNYYLGNNGNSEFISLYNMIHGKPGDHLATLVIYVNDKPVLDSSKLMPLPKFGEDKTSKITEVKTLKDFKKVLPLALFKAQVLGKEVVLDRIQPHYGTAKQLFGSFNRFCQDYSLPCEVVSDYQMEIKLGRTKLAVVLGPVPDGGKFIDSDLRGIKTVKEKNKNEKVDMRKLEEFLKYFGQEIRDPILNSIKKGKVYTVKYNIARKDVAKTAGLQESTYEDACRLGFDYSLQPDSKGIHYLSYKGKRLIGFKWYK